MNFFKIYKQLIYPQGRIKYLLISLIIAFLILGYIIVKVTGGTAFAYLHFLYIPIILAGLIFSVRGGVLAGLAAGLLIGPFMPTSIEYDFAQPLSSWATRLGFFVLVGAIAGMGSSVFKAYLRELEIKQTTDPLTGLPNLHGLKQIFPSLVQDEEKALIVIVVELFQIREVDRALGTAGSDMLLREVANDLTQVIGNLGILGHLQTHRFAILIPNEDNVNEILKRCELLSDRPYHIDHIPLFVEMRFGIARYPYDDRDLSNLTRKALIAINVPKNQADKISHYNKNIDDSSERNLLILHQLKTAIERKNLTLEYQPKVYLKTDKALGFEALVRWVDPLLGPISPEVFIPLVEETLLINSFTKWLLETAFQQMHEWSQKGLLVPVSVNFSMRNFHDSTIFETLNQLLDTYQISPHFLQVEVTETSVASSISVIARALKNLRELGITTAIDDFGTGQASQQYLLELPIDVIKIDKVFVQTIAQNPAAAAIVKNAITLAHDLKIEVIAEGVETQNQYHLLKEWGCDAGQGYLIGKSMKGEEAMQWLIKKGVGQSSTPSS
ncbi:MAG: GGDEF domain-containing phosphodiesterase [Alphaproteobacteria bacterium]|nr:GGDEF domain-containing phosphodiesterase [Alphaproteobacteria bacterium]